MKQNNKDIFTHRLYENLKQYLWKLIQVPNY